jgi:phage replication O-like protein O
MTVTSGADIQVDRGEYTRIHNAILERLAEYDFTSREYACILHLLRQTYGFNRKEVKLSYGDFRDATGIDPAHVSRTMKKLVDYGVVVKTDARTKAAATWSFNKYFEQWTIQSRLKTPKDDDAIYCQKSNSLDAAQEHSIAETATELLPNEQQMHAKRAIDDCQKSNSYISAKDNIKDNSKERKDAPASVPVEQPNTYFGMPVPKRQQHVMADGYTQDAAKAGVNAVTFRGIVDALVDGAGWRKLVDDAEDDASLNYAKRDAIKLIRMGTKTIEQAQAVVAACKAANKWRDDNYMPKPHEVATYASQLGERIPVAVTPTTANGKVSGFSLSEMLGGS